MGTKAVIGIRHVDGSIRASTAYYDGYTRHTLPILVKHYNTYKKASELIDHGDVQSVMPEIGEKHAWNDLSRPERCKFYHRDRNEDWSFVYPIVYSNLKELMNSVFYNGYVYIFADNNWQHYVNGELLVLEPLDANNSTHLPE